MSRLQFNSKLRTRAVSSVAFAAILLAGPASAQSYYARERLIGSGGQNRDGDAAWHAGGWSASSSTCSEAAQQTRAVSCRRPSGAVLADAACEPAARPESSQTVSDLSGCAFEAGAVVAYGPWSSTCSDTATRSEQHSCLRSDGTVVADAHCSAAGVALSKTSDTTAILTGCSFEWETGVWSAPSSNCSDAAVQTRSLSCRRSDGAAAADDQCGGTKPEASQSVADHSGCGYEWKSGNWGAWSSTCSSTATHTRSVTCGRSDGATVDDFQCQGAKPDTTETKPNYSYCASTFANGGFESPGQGWTGSWTTLNDGGKRSGQFYARLAAGGGNFSQVIRNPRGPTATFTIWVKTNPDKCRTLNVSLRDTANSNQQTNGTATTITACGGWSSGTITSVLGGASDPGQYRLYMYNVSDGPIYVDDVTLEQH